MDYLKVRLEIHCFTDHCKGSINSEKLRYLKAILFVVLVSDDIHQMALGSGLLKESLGEVYYILC